MIVQQMSLSAKASFLAKAACRTFNKKGLLPLISEAILSSFKKVIKNLFRLFFQY